MLCASQSVLGKPTLSDIIKRAFKRNNGNNSGYTYRLFPGMESPDAQNAHFEAFVPFSKLVSNHWTTSNGAVF